MTNADFLRRVLEDIATGFGGLQDRDEFEDVIRKYANEMLDREEAGNLDFEWVYSAKKEN